MIETHRFGEEHFYWFNIKQYTLMYIYDIYNHEYRIKISVGSKSKWADKQQLKTLIADLNSNKISEKFAKDMNEYNQAIISESKLKDLKADAFKIIKNNEISYTIYDEYDNSYIVYVKKIIKGDEDYV